MVELYSEPSKNRMLKLRKKNLTVIKSIGSTSRLNLSIFNRHFMSNESVEQKLVSQPCGSFE